MHDGILTAVCALVHRHVLRELHDMTGALLARLDGEVVAKASYAAPPLQEPSSTSASSSEPATVARRARLVRAKKRQAATEKSGAAQVSPACQAGLRKELAAALERRGLSRWKAAPQIKIAGGTLRGYLAGKPISAGSLTRIADWLARLPPPEEAPVDDSGEPLPLYNLAPAEIDRLAGHLAIGGNGRELRERFGATRELLERACGGAHLNAEIIARLRQTLGNGAAVG